MFGGYIVFCIFVVQNIYNKMTINKNLAQSTGSSERNGVTSLIDILQACGWVFFNFFQLCRISKKHKEKP